MGLNIQEIYLKHLLEKKMGGEKKVGGKPSDHSAGLTVKVRGNEGLGK